MKKILSGCMLLCIFYVQDSYSQQNILKETVAQRPATDHINSFYISNRAPLQPLCFIKLPVGSIKPEGGIFKFITSTRWINGPTW